MAYCSRDQFSDFWRYDKYSCNTIARQEYFVIRTNGNESWGVASSAPPFKLDRPKVGWYKNETKISEKIYKIAKNNLSAIPGPGAYYPHASTDLTTGKPTYSDYLKEIQESDRVQDMDNGAIYIGAPSDMRARFNTPESFKNHYLTLATTYKVEGFRLLNIYKTAAYVAIKIAIVCIPLILIYRVIS